jgi:holo-[acyl-carrier protein] synthase
MKITVGNDLVHIPGFKKSLNPAFKARVFTAKEIGQIKEYKANPAVRYATTWAAKEAVHKALKQLCKGPPGLKWKDIEIIRNNNIPIVKISKPSFKDFSFSLALSHDQDYAFAVVIVYTN